MNTNVQKKIQIKVKIIYQNNWKSFVARFQNVQFSE